MRKPATTKKLVPLDDGKATTRGMYREIYGFVLAVLEDSKDLKEARERIAKWAEKI